MNIVAEIPKSKTGPVMGTFPAHAGTDVTESLRGRESVLIVEDEPSLLKVTAMLLRWLGYSVTEALAPSEAEHHVLTRGKFDLLLTDFAMPERNGLELARWVRERHPETKVLIATGSPLKYEQAVREGENYPVLAKPFDSLQLGRMLRYVLQSA